MTAARTRRMKVRWRPLTASCGHYVLRGEFLIWKHGRWTCQPCALPPTKTTAASPAAAAPEERT